MYLSQYSLLLRTKKVSVVKIAPGSWNPEVRLYNFYLSLVRTKVIAIVINYITI